VNPIGPQDYADFLACLKQQIRQRQYQALRAVNHELVALYWEVGESISRKQDERGWGKSVVENLARDLQLEFPGRNEFSAQNLWLMRQFYREYHDKPILQPLVREISWAGCRAYAPAAAIGDAPLAAAADATATGEHSLPTNPAHRPDRDRLAWHVGERF
jgi:hypothetical protein